MKIARLNLKKWLSAIFLGSLLGGMVIHASAGGGAQFNFLSGDKEFFTGRNITASQTDLVDPVNANPGDTVEGALYYHNGVENSTATNVRVSVTLPPQVDAKSLVLNAKLTSDNAPIITDTVVNGQIVGPTGLTIISSAATQLDVVPGSVRWFPDGSATPVPLLNGQSGAELFTSGGLSLGDIAGCWAHAGYVLFRVKLHPPVVTPQLKLTKEVSVGASNTVWSGSAKANVGDTVNFRLTTTNPGDGRLDNVTLVDTLPNGLVYQSATIYPNGATDGVPLTGDISKNLSLGALDAGKTTTVIIVTKVAGNFPCGDSVLTNTATVTAGALSATSSAMVTVNISGGVCVGQPNIEKSKKAYNDTQKVDATTVTANPGDQITYTLTTKNSGTAPATDFVVVDGIKDILDYTDVVSISDNGKTVDNPNAIVRDDQTSVQYPPVTIAAGASIDRTFVVKLKSPVPTNPQNGTAFDFVMFNVYGNKVVINVARPTTAVLSITKAVRNVTKSETSFVSNNTASPGDTLEYEIHVKNSGDKVVTGALLKDILPNGVKIVDGSISARNGTKQLNLSGDLLGNGLNLPDMPQTTEIIVNFKVVTATNLADSTNLKNVAQLICEGTKEATASTVIIAPTQPTPTPSPNGTPPPTVPPTVPALPSAGADPFGILMVASGSIYTAYSRFRIKREFLHLSDYVKIV